MPRKQASSAYTAVDDEFDIEALSGRLAADLRSGIRLFGSFPVLSAPWNDMAASLARIANISDMEKKLPKEKEGATLWECEEIALRYLLEDGKLNVSLRNLSDMKSFEIRHRDGDAAPASVIEKAPDALAKLEKFEKGLGIVLRNAWEHIEAIQTTDVPLMVNHSADMLDDAMKNEEWVKSRAVSDGGKLDKRQEVIIMHYLASLVSQSDELGEERYMPIIRERGIFMQIANFLNMHSAIMCETDLQQGAIALSLICETEDFTSFKKQYVDYSDEDVRGSLNDLNEDDGWLEEMREDDDDFRSKVRPLMAILKECKRYKRK
jgi:hypothetical protein